MLVSRSSTAARGAVGAAKRLILRWNPLLRSGLAGAGCALFALTLISATARSVAASDASVFSSYESARESAGEGGDSTQDLLRVLGEQSEVAARTRLNVDRVPGIVSVVYGRDLAARGARTVHEALALVPGVQTAISGTGLRQVIVRGAGKVLRSGKIKVLLNGVQANSVFSGEAAAVFAIPIEQVERIEVVRGPGSALHGEYAYVGVINVITRQRGDEVFTRFDEHGGVTAGATFGYSSEDRDLRLRGSLAGFSTDGSGLRSGPDALYGTPHEPLSNAGGKILDGEEQRSGFFSLDYRDTSLELQYLRSDLGDFFGGANTLPDHRDRIATEQEWWSVSAAQDLRLDRSLSVEFEVGLNHYSEDVDFQIFPAGFTAGPFAYPDGMFFGYGYPHERRVWGSAKLRCSGFDGHRLMMGVTWARAEASGFFQRANFDLTTFEPLDGKARFTGAQNFLSEGDAERDIASALVQDEISLGDRLTVTVGGRYDDYSDVGGNFSPRLAAVWRLRPHHSFKAQYAEAFRPPSFIELSARGLLFVGDPDLRPETVRTFELAYIYNSGSSVLRATVFHSLLSDSIGRGEKSFANQADGRISGAELEFSRELTRRLSLQGEVSFADSEDDATGRDFPDVARWTGNVGLRFTPHSGRTLSLDYRYVGERPRAEGDPRRSLAGENSVDLTVTLESLFGTGFGLRLGVRNLFDEDLFAPAAPGTYPGDYPRPGREVWGGVSHEF